MTDLRARLEVAGRLRVELSARKGEVVAVIGPNGAGKSTLLRALAGVISHQGEVVVEGESWTEPLRPVRERRVGVVFQDQLLFPHLSVLQNVAFGPRSRGASRVEADELAVSWLERFGIADLSARKPSALSGGQAQRVAIARALAAKPALLLLDEPFSGLDVGVAAGLRIELARHLSSYDGITLLVTHEAIDALTLADRVVVLDDGEIAQVGSPREVAAQPRTEHVARLVGLNVLREGDRFVSFSPGVVTVSLDEPASSARHRWAGVIAHATPHGTSVRLLVTGPHELLADVTPEASGELGLQPGRPVWLSVKESAVTGYSAI
jgi:molybdate transport system ATP-binding protein